jgi:hypothetical protein
VFGQYFGLRRADFLFQFAEYGHRRNFTRIHATLGQLPTPGGAFGIGQIGAARH